MRREEIFPIWCVNLGKFPTYSNALAKISKLIFDLHFPWNWLDFNILSNDSIWKNPKFPGIQSFHSASKFKMLQFNPVQYCQLYISWALIAPWNSGQVQGQILRSNVKFNFPRNWPLFHAAIKAHLVYYYCPYCMGFDLAVQFFM